MVITMKKIYTFLYTFVCICIFTFLIFIAVYDANHNTRTSPSITSLEYWTDYHVEYMSDGSSKIVGTLKTNPSVGNVLAFYSIHQNITLSINHQIIYQYPFENDYLLSETPGYNWNFISLPYSENNITIDISSPYSNYGNRAMTFYVGNIASITSYILTSSLSSFLVCVVIFCFGICMTGYWFVTNRKTNMQKSILYLGIFAILLSIWSINETSIMTLLMRNNIVSVYISFLTLMLLPFAFSLFVKCFYEEDNLKWDIFHIINLIQIITCIFLQIFRIYDFRQTLWSTHLMFLILTILTLSSSLRHIKSGVHAKRAITHIVCIFVCAIALATDMINFYKITKDSNHIGRLSFLLYFIVLGMTASKESAILMKLGKKANVYQHLAFTDQMTQLKNRTAFNNDFKEFMNKPSDIVIFDFDLNSLKQINDTQGHSLGDQYIIRSAQIIKDVFSCVGSCYRVGGDEFVVIIENSSLINIPLYLNRLEWNIDLFNKEEQTSFNMDIAYGFAVYDSNLDTDLEDTYNRADKEMYKNKMQKKAAYAQNKV